MKPNLMKFLKFFFIITLIVFVVCIVGGLVLYLEWPWWMAFFILIGLWGLWLAGKFFGKLVQKRRERKFIQQVIDQEETYGRSLGDEERGKSRALQERWKEAVATLKSSHLRKFGNPLYVLPWYMVIGESGTGKTTAIKSAGLSSAFAEINRTSGISGTRNCDWWFFEQAIILDTAGRYAIPVDEGRDKEEWQNFLSLLVRYRKKEPLNGLVVTIGADKLLEAEPGALEEDGRDIRRRIDELMRSLGARFPVYLMVTKCDLVQGMTQFCDQLSRKAQCQAMGSVNHDMSKEIAEFHERSAHTIGERLRDLRLLMLHGTPSEFDEGIDPGLLLFPEEFEKLNPGLRAFIQGAFQENPYQETPLLRGIYYSSGKQEGRPFSHFLKSLGLIEERDVLPDASRGLFLYDLFSRILPGDRKLFAPTLQAVQWGRLTRNLGLTSWIAVLTALCGLLSFSFVKNMGAMRDASEEFSNPQILQGDIVQDLALMDRFREAIETVETGNRNWWTPRLGLNTSIDVEKGLKRRYCERFKESFIGPFDERIIAVMSAFSETISDETAARYTDHLVKRIHLLRARLEEESLQTLLDMDNPSFFALPFEGASEPPSDVRRKFAVLHAYYLAWNRGGRDELERRMIDMQAWLKHILIEKRDDLNWLVTWANNEPTLSSVKLEDFWGGEADPPDEIIIHPAYTRQGGVEIEKFIGKIEAALPDPLIIVEQKGAFQKRLHQVVVDAWYTFGALFPSGEELLLGRDHHQRAAARIVAGKGPCVLFLDRLASELEPFSGSGLGPAAGGKKTPAWMELVFAFKTARIQAAAMNALERKDAPGKTPKKGKQLISKLEKKVGAGLKGSSLEVGSKAGQAFNDYEKAIREIKPTTVSGKAAFEMATAGFSEDPAAGASPFFRAARAENQLLGSLTPAGASDKMFTDLISLPRLFLWQFVNREAACHLNHLWEKEVLVEVQGVTNKKQLNDLLMGPDGHALKFIKEGPGKPFLMWSAKRKHHAREVMGVQLPFDASFFTLLTKGASAARAEPEPTPAAPRSNYFVSVRALPTDANDGARQQPHKTVVELHCASGAKRLVNLNFPVRETFSWSPDLCGDVVFKIEIGNLILEKRYKGNRGFPRFLRSFVSGQRTFFPIDFPGRQDALRELGVKHIKVSYEFTGARPLLGLLERETRAAKNRKAARARIADIPDIQRSIATCWIQ
ncbi:MAG: type VI secretion system protein ImpL [Desulfobacterales bacterium]|nr:type VI secretion system protein ImpL [Desulfobacterales bacterium]